jgi:hypothetical protein
LVSKMRGGYPIPSPCPDALTFQPVMVDQEKRAQEAEAARKKEEAKQSSEEEEEGGGSDSWDDKDVNEIKVPARKESIPELVKEEEEEDEEEEEKEEVEAVVEKTKPVTKVSSLNLLDGCLKAIFLGT